MVGGLFINTFEQWIYEFGTALSTTKGWDYSLFDILDIVFGS